MTSRPAAVRAPASPLADEIGPGPAVPGTEARPGTQGVRRPREPPLSDDPGEFGSGREELPVKFQVDQIRPVGGWAPRADCGPQQPIGEPLALVVLYLQGRLLQ